MMRFLADAKYDLISKRKVAAIGSTVFVIAGLALFSFIPREKKLGIDFLDGRLELAERSVAGEGFALTAEARVEARRADGNGAEQELEYTGDVEFEVLFSHGPPVRHTAPVVEGRAVLEATLDRIPVEVRLDPRLLHIDRDLDDNVLSVTETTPSSAFNFKI